MHSTTCTSCSVRLKSARPLADGTRIKCPKCTFVFTVCSRSPEFFQASAITGLENETAASESATKPRRTRPLVIWSCSFAAALVYFGLPMLLIAFMLPPTKPSAARRKAARFSVTADQFHREFKEDRKAARNKYYGTEVEVAGVVNTFLHFQGKHLVFLKAKGNRAGMGFVMADPEPWARLVPGQQVKLKGKGGRQYGMDTLLDCVIVEAGRNPAIKTTAAGLASQFAANHQAATDQYSGKWIYISGTIVRKVKDPPYDGIVLKTGSGVKVVCNFFIDDEDYLKPLQIGQAIRAVGRFDELSEKGLIMIDSCELITK